MQEFHCLRLFPDHDLVVRRSLGRPKGTVDAVFEDFKRDIAFWRTGRSTLGIPRRLLEDTTATTLGAFLEQPAVAHSIESAGAGLMLASIDGRLALCSEVNWIDA